MTIATDPGRRGAHILDAALTVIAGEGSDALSMRRVAAASGVSLAQVQYYFRTKAELVAAAFEYAGDQFLASLKAVDAAPVTLARLRRILWLWLPLDADRERRARVWLAYSATAATHPALAATSAQLDDDLRAWLAQELDALQRTGELTAAQLLALIDGTVLQSLVLPIDAREAFAERILGAWLDARRPAP